MSVAICKGSPYSKLLALKCMPVEYINKWIFNLFRKRFYWKRCYRLRDRFYHILNNKYKISRHRIQSITHSLVCGQYYFEIHYLSHRRHKRITSVWLGR